MTSCNFPTLKFARLIETMLPRVVKLMKADHTSLALTDDAAADVG